MRRLAAATALAVLTACAGDSTAGVHGAWTAERVHQGDTLVVRTVAGSVWGDTMTLVPELAVGELDGEGPYVFGQVAAVEVDPEGRLVVLDRQAGEVRVFSPEGAFIRTIGRMGQGPGEFGRPGDLRVTSDGRVVVRDQPGGRYHVFGPEGEALGAGWPDRPMRLGGVRFFLDHQDRVLDPVIPDPDLWRPALVRYTLDGAALDTIPVPDTGFEPVLLEVVQDGGVGRYTIPFWPSERWTADGQGRLLHGVSDRYRIHRVEPDGTVLAVERQVPPAPVAPGEAAWHREMMTSTMRSVAAGTWRWDGPDIPTRKPAFRQVVGASDGSMWVFRYTPAAEEPVPGWDPEHPETVSPTRWVEPVVADVFDADGRYLGPVRFPDGVQHFAGPHLTASHVTAAVLHELGHPQVVRFRLAPATGPDAEGSSAAASTDEREKSDLAGG